MVNFGIIILYETKKYIQIMSALDNTFGEKPRSFRIEENGEYYYIGSEVTITLLYICHVYIIIYI